MSLCFVCSYRTDPLTEHRFDVDHILSRRAGVEVKIPIDGVCHPECCPGSCDSPQDHAAIGIV